MTAPAPFIVWTLRRTGGTNLAQALFERAPFPALPHEPFNIDRAHGAITRRWLADRDPGAFREALQPVLARGSLIKHCVETVEGFPNTLLAQAAEEAGYRHLFLYRHDPLERLLSLVFAERSGIWGARDAAQKADDPEVFQRPLNIAWLVAHERRAREALLESYRCLGALGASIATAAFEDIFLASLREGAVRRIHRILTLLGLAGAEAADAAWIDRVLDGGDQGTRARYHRFADRAALARALAALGPLTLDETPAAAGN